MLLISAFIDVDDPANAAVVGLAVTFLAFAALFQVADGAQAVAAGMLRGLHDTNGADDLTRRSAIGASACRSACVLAFHVRLRRQRHLDRPVFRAGRGGAAAFLALATAGRTGAGGAASHRLRSRTRPSAGRPEGLRPELAKSRPTPRTWRRAAAGCRRTWRSGRTPAPRPRRRTPTPTPWSACSRSAAR